MVHGGATHSFGNLVTQQLLLDNAKLRILPLTALYLVDGCLSTTPKDGNLGAEPFQKRPLKLKSSGQAVVRLGSSMNTRNKNVL